MPYRDGSHSAMWSKMLADIHLPRGHRTRALAKAKNFPTLLKIYVG